MTLEELERHQEVRFPQAFCRIYETGAMKWLTLTKDELKARRQEYVNDSKAFLMLNCDCEMYLFEEIAQASMTLAEWISWREQDKGVKLRDGVKLVPFGHSCGGDIYCLLYSDDNNEPMVIKYSHDSYAPPTIEGHDLDEFVYIQLLLAAENEEDVEGDNFTENMKYLSEKYLALVEGKDADELTDDLYALGVEQAEIWE